MEKECCKFNYLIWTRIFYFYFLLLLGFQGFELGFCRERKQEHCRWAVQVKIGVN